MTVEISMTRAAGCLDAFPRFSKDHRDHNGCNERTPGFHHQVGFFALIVQLNAFADDVFVSAFESEMLAALVFDKLCETV